MCRFMGVLRQREVMEIACPIRVETEVELILPAELESRSAERIITRRRTRVAFRQIGGMGGNLVGDDAFAHIILIG